MDNTVRLWVLLSKQQDGALSGEEAAELERLQNDPANNVSLATYAQLDAYWRQLAVAKGADSLEFWEKHRARLEKEPLDADLAFSPAAAAPNRPWYQKTRIWVAAAAIILFALGLSMLFKKAGKVNTGGDTVIIVHNGNQKQVTLPDGTKVWLNSGSELSYTKYFASAPIKEVYLKGEAFFDIRHDPKRTFIIHTEYLDIKDLGTRFNVKAYTYEDRMETTLINGSVEVYPKNHPEQMIRLKPNEKIVFDTKVLRSGKFLRIKNAEQQDGLHLDSIENRISGTGSIAATGYYVAKLKPKIKSGGDSIMLETAWMQHQLAFNAITFEDLSRNMERWYDVDIDITNANVANYIFTGVFKEEAFQEALSELQMIQPFQYEIQGRKVRIY
ncbi:FecR family protein [Arachidicoccus terrestris]|uniref:FecR family protein n=1 Tax=Arachidicoccus terrestris TaxID=2875539 RepID=UPI001CC35537|nr:FecR family protein [Arachidicoccus terrestris]UAY56904.1 FecR family protein [Arachidicoccus terrestris]